MEATASFDEVGTTTQRAMEGLRTPPALDPAVVPAAQHLGHGPPPELGRAGVVRLLQQPGGTEALGHGTRGVSHRTGQEAGHRLDDQARRDLAAVQHHVAHAQLPVDEVLAHTVVDALVSSAQQAEPGVRTAPAEVCQFVRQLLVEALATRAEQVQRARRIGCLDGGEDRFWLHHHPRAATERRVVHRAVDVVGVLAQIVQPEVEQAVGAALAEQALPAEVVDEAREDREHVDPHGCRAYGTVFPAPAGRSGHVSVPAMMGR